MAKETTMQPLTPVVTDHDAVDVTTSLAKARRYGDLTDQTAPFLTQQVSLLSQADGTVSTTVTLQWPNGSHTTGTAQHTDEVEALVGAYQDATASVAAKIASVRTVTTSTVLLEGGLGAEPVTHVVVRLVCDNKHCVADGTHTDVHEAAWQAVSDIYTWVLMYD